MRNEKVIDRILDSAKIERGKTVLDVACGTGVLIPDYLERAVGSVTGVDISPEMIKIASEKFSAENVSFLCADAETDDIGSGYDVIVIYNAFPHFPNPGLLISRLSGLLAAGGRLTVAHGMSRKMIDSHHNSVSAHKVTNGLMHETELKALFEPYFDVDIKISDDCMYQVSGIKK